MVMSEEDLRIRQIKMKIPTLTFEQAREVSKLCSEYYIEGLEQSRFDKNMLEEENKGFKKANVEFVSKNNKLQHRIYSAIDYIDQVIGYKPAAREIDEELNILIGILRGGYDEGRK